MTDLDTDRPHLVTAPHLIPNTGTWFGWCSCGSEFMAGSADEVRAAGRPHRDAEQKRLQDGQSSVEGGAVDVG